MVHSGIRWRVRSGIALSWRRKTANLCSANDDCPSGAFESKKRPADTLRGLKEGRCVPPDAREHVSIVDTRAGYQTEIPFIVI